MKTLKITYDFKTQRGLVLRLRARLGQHFELRFRPIGINGGDGKKEEEKGPLSIMSLPAELIDFITMLLVKTNPTSAETKGLFSFARTSAAIREFLENPQLERALTLQVLGVRHSRTREERHLGLERNVKKRYGDYRKETGDSKEVREGVLGLLGLPAEALQDMANRNKIIYKDKSEEAYYPFIAFRPEYEEGDRRISAWPWWYLRLLSNHLSLQSMKRPFTDETDGFISSEVLVELESPSRRFTDSSVKGASDIMTILGLGQSSSIRADMSHKWSAGADLIVIPLDTLADRVEKLSAGVALYGDPSPSKDKITKRIFRIVVSEYIGWRQRVPPSGGRGLYRKEVTVTGKIKNNVDISLALYLHNVYVGNSTMVNFLTPKQDSRSRLRIEYLSLRHIYFETPTQLDLSGATGEFLIEFRFGPTNMNQTPKLSCPSSLLKEILLVGPVAPKTGILLWDIPDDTATAAEPCFPELTYLRITGNVGIWKPMVLERLSKFPKLKHISLERFTGTTEDLDRIGKIMEQAPQSRTNEGIEVVVWFEIDPDDPQKTREYYDSLLNDYYDKFDGVRF